MTLRLAPRFSTGPADADVFAARIAEAINLLLNNDNGTISSPVLDPVTSQPCWALADVTILVSNYYSLPHPVPQFAAFFDLAVQFY